MEKVSVSINFLNTEPIALNDLLAMAYDPQTPDEYADYIHYVLRRAKKTTERVGQKLSVIKFKVHKTGAILPFGEGQEHPFSKNFYTEVWMKWTSNYNNVFN